MEVHNPRKDEPDLDTRTFINSLNEKLSSAGAGNAELAFGLGCGISIVPIGILMLVLYILGLRGWVGFMIVALIGVLLATTISTYLASRARAGAIRQAYDRDVELQILQYLKFQNLDKNEFRRIVDQILPPDAPLVKHLASESVVTELRKE